MIVLNDLSFFYENSGASIEHLDMQVREGELVVLLGTSGSGKTSVTRVINGLASTFYPGILLGELLLAGQSALSLAQWERGRLVASVFQDPRSQFFSHRVEGEIAYTCENYGYEQSEIRQRVTNALHVMGIDNLRKREVAALSNGEKQKIGIASAYAMQPPVMVFDEPSANLDPEATQHLVEVLSLLKEQGYTMVVAEHRCHYLLDLADRFSVLEQGRIAEELLPSQLLTLNTQELAARGLRSPRLSASDCPSLPRQLDDAALQVENLSFCYSQLEVLRGVSFAVPRGSIVAIEGRNGRGKTTLARVIAGLEREHKGSISINGIKQRSRERRRSVRFVAHDTTTQVFAESVVKELLLTVGHDKHLIEKALQLLDAFGLAGYQDCHPLSLSGGQRQRLVVASALMEERDILIFDEPTSGLDAQNMCEVARAMKRASEEQKTVLIITHDQELIQACCSYSLKLAD